MNFIHSKIEQVTREIKHYSELLEKKERELENKFDTNTYDEIAYLRKSLIELRATDTFLWKMLSESNQPAPSTSSALVPDVEMILNRFVEKLRLSESENRTVSPHVQSVENVNKAVLAKLIEPFDEVPDLTDCANEFLSQPLNCLIPAPSTVYNDFGREAREGVFELSDTKVASDLMFNIGSWLLSPIPSGTPSEQIWSGIYDKLLVHFIEGVDLHPHVICNRNTVDRTISTPVARPDYVLWLSNCLVVKGEQKANTNDYDKAVEELTAKHRGGSYVYWNVPRIFAFVTAGHKYGWYTLSTKKSPDLIPVVQHQSIKSQSGRIDFLKCWINIIRWVATIEKHRLLSPISVPMFKELTRPNVFIPDSETVMLLDGVVAHKNYYIPNKHASYLGRLYAMLRERQRKHLVFPTKFKVVYKGKSYEISSEQQFGMLNPLLYSTYKRCYDNCSDEQLLRREIDDNEVLQFKLRLSPLGAPDNTPKTMAEYKYFATCILKALRALHNLGYCHRDVRFANTVRTTVNSWCLIDLERAAPAGMPVYWDQTNLPVTGKGGFKPCHDLQMLAKLLRGAKHKSDEFSGFLKLLNSSESTAESALMHVWITGAVSTPTTKTPTATPLTATTPTASNSTTTTPIATGLTASTSTIIRSRLKASKAQQREVTSEQKSRTQNTPQQLERRVQKRPLTSPAKGDSPNLKNSKAK